MPSRQGSPNKNKAFLLDRLKKMYGDDFDPIINACKNAIRMSEMANDGGEEEFNMRKECVNAWDKIAHYVTPKLKAVEMSGELQHKPHEDWLDLLDGQ